ncbi:hypothetical protein DL89DRAFT_269289 [Linderina pennispora]|uniref:ABC transporter domain-containing protein n=1 Tax=Linderina pennispora TaxID=61395 RepID=A0A1Y1W1U1_9FUNG|nr:uncharacterized protein DL89DRAFT_269289 [Linderina pennispora]ORX67491.1 hypothetical protein DL89DRAFT_269289 [Linderina pennispora]
MAKSITSVGILADIALLVLGATSALTKATQRYGHQRSMVTVFLGSVSLMSQLLSTTPTPTVGSTVSLMSSLMLFSWVFGVAGVSANSQAIAHGVRTMRLTIAEPSDWSTTSSIAVLSHLALAWACLAPATKRAVTNFLANTLFLNTLLFMYTCTKRDLVHSDVDDPVFREQTLREYENLRIMNKTRVSVVRRLISCVWKEMLLVSAAELAILLGLGFQHIQQGRLLVLYAVWVVLGFLEIVHSYLSIAKRAMVKRTHAVLQLKVAEAYVNRRHNEELDKEYEDFGSWSTYTVSSSAHTVVDLAARIVAITFNLWIISCSIGWRALIPVLFTVGSMVSEQLVANRIAELLELSKAERQPHFPTDATSLISNMRTVKFYGWEHVFDNLSANVDLPHFTPPLLWSTLSYILDIMNTATVELSTALTLLSYLRSDITVSYAEIMLVVNTTGQLTTCLRFTSSTLSTFRDTVKALGHLASLVADDKREFLAHSRTCNTLAVDICQCEFQWDKGSFALAPISLTIKPGEFVVVVGRVGSGKSSLLSALCGDMPMISGQGHIYGRVGYVSQKPWIMNATFRENVLFGQEFDEKFYWRVVEACALADDVKQFRARDQTEIGSRGINLSGGQKVRLALARAIYSRADIYLFDDILAAVDSCVERQIVERVLTGNGIISDKARVLVTHAEYLLPLANMVVMLENGSASIRSQVPATLTTAVSETPPMEPDSAEDDGTNGDSGIFTISPELDVPQFQLSYLWRYLSMSGAAVTAIPLVILVVTSIATHRVNSYRLDILSESDQTTMVASLRWYLAIHAALSIGIHCSYLILKWKVRQITREAVRDTLLLPLGVLSRLFDSGRSQMSILLPELLSSKLSTLLDALFSIAIIGQRMPFLYVFLLPMAVLGDLAREKLEKLGSSLNTIGSHSIILEIIQGRQTMRIYGAIDLANAYALNNVMNSVMYCWSAIYQFFLTILLMSLDSSSAMLTMSVWIYTLVNPIIRSLKKLPREAHRVVKGSRPPQGWPSIGTYLDKLDTPCEKVGIIGRTGAGKSSLTGSIFIDGIDISTIGLQDLHPALFEFTDDEGQIEDAILRPTYAHVKDDRRSGPWVSENGGKNFSVGQRQLILVLDEATANQDCTVLTVAHRLRTVMDIAEFDTPTSLLERDSLFKLFVESMELNNKC